MKQQQEPIVVHAEALYGGDVLLTFEDFSCAVYSLPLLRSMLPLTEGFVDEELAAIRRANPTCSGVPSGTSSGSDQSC